MGDDAGRQRAVELRLAGYSRAQIARALGVKTGGQALSRWLKGVRPPEWTGRPNAKDELRERAVALRLEGRSYREITELLGVSKGTLSSWLRDVPLTEEQREVLDGRQREASRRGAASLRANRLRREQRIWSEARGDIAEVSGRELFLVGVVAYWSEGAKSKPWRPGEQVALVNSDADVIRVFLAWLRLLGVTEDDLTFRVAIHQSADVAAAVTYWSDVVGVPEGRFSRTTLKRHNPKTVRRNVGQGYHGCLTIGVRRSTDLNRRIAGWWQAIVASVLAGNPWGPASISLPVRGGVTAARGPLESLV